MIDIGIKTYERTCTETIVENDGILCLNEKKQKKDQIITLREITINYHSNHRGHKYELAGQPKKQSNRVIDEKLAIRVTMDC